jgi:hypothetical protein
MHFKPLLLGPAATSATPSRADLRAAVAQGVGNRRARDHRIVFLLLSGGTITIASRDHGKKSADS